jgi:starch synthase
VHTAILTREFPPDVYGGAGVHVEYLVRELRKLIDVDVHCFGDDRPGAVGHRPDATLTGANPALTTLSVDLSMVAATAGVELLHSHTWYANMAGHLGKLLHGVPHVVTAHSLEPHRPWKAEQLGGGYRLSSWAEKTAYEAADAIISVSAGMKDGILESYPALDPDRVHVIRNGIDTEIQLVLCAGAPDTPEIAAETKAAIEELQASRPGVFWFDGMLTLPQVKQVLSASTVFVCPSVYEPLGIVNLEAMACGAAVVASDVGGIPEVVDDGVTGTLVHYDSADAEGFERGIADAVNAVVADPTRARKFGRAGRERAQSQFSWTAIAEQTVELYRSLL